MDDRVYELSIGQMFNTVLKNWWIVLLATILGAALAFGYTAAFVTPMYVSSATLSVSGNVTSYQEAILGETFAKDGEEIITSSLVLQKAADRLNDPDDECYTPEVETAKSIRLMIKTEVTEGTRFFDVSVECDDPIRAEKIATAVVESFCEALAQGNIIENGRGVVIGHPTVPEAPSSPNKTSSILIGAFIGIVLSVGVMLIIKLSRDEIDSEDWLVRTYGEKIPLLSVIPDVTNSGYGYKKYSSYTSKQ